MEVSQKTQNRNVLTFTDIKRITKEYHEQVYVYKLDNFAKMARSLE